MATTAGPDVMDPPGRIRSLPAGGVALLGSTIIGSLLVMYAVLRWAHVAGPANFARYSLAYSLAAVVSIPAGYGIGSATMRLLAQRADARQRARHRRMAIRQFCLVCLVVTVSMLALGSFVRGGLRIESGVYVAGVVLGAAMSLYLFAEYLLKGQSRVPALAILRLATSAGFLVLLAPPGMAVLGSFLAPVTVRGLPFLVAGAGIVAVTLKGSHRLARGDIPTGASESAHAMESLEHPRRFTRFALGAAVASAASIFLLYVDKLVLTNVLPLRELGIYAGYFTGSYLLLARGGEVLISVLFPGAVRQDSRNERRLARVGMLALPIGFVAALAGQYASLLLLGPRFPFIWPLAALFAVSAGLFVAADARWWLLVAAEGVRGVGRFGRNGIWVAALVTLGMLSLPRVFGLYGAALSLCAASLYSFLASHRRSAGTPKDESEIVRNAPRA